MANGTQPNLDFFDLQEATFFGQPITFDATGQMVFPAFDASTLGANPFTAPTSFEASLLSQALGPQPLSQPFTPEQALFTQMGLGGATGFGALPGFTPTLAGPGPAGAAGVTGPALPALSAAQVIGNPEIQTLLGNPLLDEVFINAQGQLVTRGGAPLETDPSTWQRTVDWVNRVASTPGGSVLLALGLGGVGTALAALVAGGTPKVPAPQPAPLTPTQAAGRDVLQGALTQAPGAVQGQPALGGALTQPLGGQLGGPATSIVPGAGAFQPGTTGATDLESIVRAALAGQRNLAQFGLTGTARELGIEQQQAPLEEAIRLQALGQIPGLLSTSQFQGFPSTPAIQQQLLQALGQSTVVPPFNDPLLASLQQRAGSLLSPASPYQDPIQAGLAEQVQAALAGQSNPRLEAQFREEEQLLRQQLAQQLGIPPASVELSTPGADAIARLRERQTFARQEDQRQTIAQLSGLEAQRRQFNLLTPEQLRLQEQASVVPQTANAFQFSQQFPQASRVQNEQLRQGFLGQLLPAEVQRQQAGLGAQQQGLLNQVGVLGLGRRTPGELTASLGSMVPIAPLLGIDASQQERLLQQQFANQAALQSFGANLANQQQAAAGIGNIFGQAGGALLLGSVLRQ